MNTDRFKFRVWDNLINRYWDAGTVQLGDDGAVFVLGMPDRMPEYLNDIIIEQCTGLRDKNGKLIYEGDIICYDDTPYNVYATKKTGPVVWHKAVFCIHYKNELGDFYDTVGANDAFWSRKTEIIGNIHEGERR